MVDEAGPGQIAPLGRNVAAKAPHQAEHQPDERQPHEQQQPEIAPGGKGAFRLGGRGVAGRSVRLSRFRFGAGAGLRGLGQGRKRRVDPGGAGSLPAAGGLFRFGGGRGLIGRAGSALVGIRRRQGGGLGRFRGGLRCGIGGALGRSVRVLFHPGQTGLHFLKKPLQLLLGIVGRGQGCTAGGAVGGAVAGFTAAVGAAFHEGTSLNRACGPPGWTE